MSTRTVSAREAWDVPVFSMWNSFLNVLAYYVPRRDTFLAKQAERP